ncbi:putative Zinc finger, SWIM-type [Plasmopara halstedii]
MSTVIGVSVLTLVALEVKQSTTKQFTDAHGEMLASLPQEDLHLIQAASELMARDLVVKITSTPSMRAFYRVESLNKYKRRDAQQDADISVSSISQPVDNSIISGNGASYYNCFSHYCTCAAFHMTTVKTHPTAMCKHMVARLLADASGQYKTMQVEDMHFAQMICSSLSVNGDSRQ